MNKDFKRQRIPEEDCFSLALAGAGVRSFLTNTFHPSLTEHLSGLVERITYHNPETGYCVLRVKAERKKELVTVVGHASTIAAGEFIQLSGQWINDRNYGVQFKAAFMKACAGMLNLKRVFKDMKDRFKEWLVNTNLSAPKKRFSIDSA